MTGIGISFRSYPARIDWGKAVSGIDRLTQNVVTNYRTNYGSDWAVARGNDLASDVRSGGLYDAQSAQHSLNFAVLDTTDFVRSVEPQNGAEALDTFSAAMAGSSGRRLAVDLTVTNKLGERVTMTASLPI